MAVLPAPNFDAGFRHLTIKTLRDSGDPGTGPGI